MMTKSLAFASLLILCVYGELVNKKVAREIDISSNIARVINTITLENSGSTKVTNFFFALPATNSSLATLFASQGEDETALKVQALSSPPSQFSDVPLGASFYEITLHEPVAADDEVDVDVEVVFSHAIHAFPREIKQKDNQLVIFYDNLHYFSPYATTEETVEVKLASATVEASYPTTGAETTESTIKYSDFNDLEAFSFELFMCHYQNNKPFVVAETMQRTVQVSHWGALQVEEFYKLRHTGAKLTGEFSRLDMMRFGAPASVASVSAVLPDYATDIYFRDVIGNISSSEVKSGKGTGEDDVDEGKVEVKMTQRFPLFGGWQTEFYYGYNLPLDRHLNITNGQYSLTFPFAPPLKEMITDDMMTSIILPEGARNIKVTVAGQAVEATTTTTYTNLDTSGRPTLTITALNVISPDNEDLVTVVYNFDSSAMLQEPILLTVGFFCMFVTSMVVSYMFF